MNIHEYQAKELLQKFDVATTPGKVAATLDEAEQIARELGDVEIVVKAQIHAGGRGKGVFKNGFKGGVHVRRTPEEVREVAAKMLGQILVTHQTGPAGRLVNKVLVAQSAEIAREIYFAILLDREIAAPLIVASPEGGVEIETVAAKSKGRNTASITSGSTETSRVWSTARGWPWQPWTSSSSTAANRQTFSTSAAARPKNR